jgi:RNA polymerase sigma-70 factor (ECF subfamily)
VSQPRCEVRTGESAALTTTKPSPSALAELSDYALVELALKREERAFEVLMRRYNRRLFRAARCVLRDDSAAEDAVQEAYLRAFTRLDRYQPTGSFGAWLTRIALNEALMLRRRTRHDTVSIEDVDEGLLIGARGVPLEASLSSDGPEAAYARQLLEQAIDTLPETFRTVFVLRVVEQLSINETAACLDLNSATVKTRLHRAQQRLRVDISRRLQSERLNVFEFDGARCDRIVVRVFARLHGSAPTTRPP